jgi:predicted DNA-binding transcriptional regulator YafY
MRYDTRDTVHLAESGTGIMNRTDRLLAIVLELQGRGRARAEDLAAQFETSKRTIYRDIEALCEAGVPVVATPGQGYTLMAGYFLPPLTFTADEALTLLLGATFVAGQFDADYRAVANVAGRKIESVLPEARRAELHALRESLQIISLPHHADAAVPQLLGTLRTAILTRHTVQFHYHARHTAQPGIWARERRADPYTLTHIGGAWYLIAHCHERRAIRKFRLERIERLRTTADTFTRPTTSPSLGIDPQDDRRVVVRAIFTTEAARWVEESRNFYVVAQDHTPEGLVVTLRVRREEDVLAWLLGWGRQVRVLEPYSLRRRIAAELAATLGEYRADLPLLT